MKQTKASSAIDWFFKDKNGRWAVIQVPNALLLGWLILLVINLLIHNLHVGLLQNAVLFTWAYLELTQGTSRFRKTLGAVILVGLVVNFFM
jgi:hypothetical protein